MKIATENLGSLRLACLGTIVLSIVACGQLADLSGTKSDSKDDGTATGTSAATNSQPFVLRGSVVSAFDIKVDSVPYKDSEDFFTQESARLPAKVKTAGYDGWTPKFDAQIGFKDLTIGMTVYTTGVNKRGYQATTVVARDGTFAMQLPPEAAGDTYKIRANKRIAVTITKENETKKFCYNFSAIDKDVPYDVKDKPIIMDEFQSSLTAYECVTDPGSNSIEIPATANDTKTTTVKTDPNLPPSTSGASTTAGTTGVIQAKITSTQKIRLVLPTKYEGGDRLTAIIVSSQGEFVLAHSPARDKETGKWCYPLERLTGLTNPIQTFSCVGETVDNLSLYGGLKSMVQIGAVIVAAMSNKILSFALDGSGFQTLDWNKQSHMLVAVDGKAKTIFTNDKGPGNSSSTDNEICDLTMIAGELASGCVKAPNNKCGLGIPQTYAYHAGSIVAANGSNAYSGGSGYCETMAIHVLSPLLALQKSYPLSTVEISAADFRISKLVSYEGKLYLFTLVGAELTVRTLQLTE